MTVSTGSTDRRRSASGQILPLAALMMIVFIGMAGLAIDVSAAYLSERQQRVVADAAALAGGQDLQIPGSRALPGATEYARAQANALAVVVSQLGGAPTGNCAELAGCALSGTPYTVSIITPSPSCVDCVSARAIQVTITQPAFGLTFARVFGQESWNVVSTSVAGIVHTRQYGVAALRPPKPRSNGSDANEKNLQIGGTGAALIVNNADVQTNTNMFLTNSATVTLDPGFDVYYYDPYKAWTGPPTGVQATSMVPDPMYPYPARTGLDTYTAEVDALADSATCLSQQALVPSTYRELKTGQPVNDPTLVTAKCYKPGIYRFIIDARDPASGLPVAVLLLPGVYHLDYGMNVNSTVIGGYVPAQPGVVLVLKEAKNQSGDPGQLTTSSVTSLFAINAGSAYLNSGGSQATAAIAPDGTRVETTATRPVLMSLMVQRDPYCVVSEPASSACRESENKTLTLTGGGNIYLAGVQYAPSDNVEMSGNSGQESAVGQLIVWTFKINSSVFRISASVNDINGVLRLDPACSPTVSVCTR